MRPLNVLAFLGVFAPALARAQTSPVQPPRLANTGWLEAAVAREYPPELLERGIGGSIAVRLHVTAEGAVDSALVADSAGDPALDSAALRVVRGLRFEPARQEGQPIPIWAVLPVEFRATPARRPKLRHEGPVQRIELLNRPAVLRELRRLYPRDTSGFGVNARLIMRVAVDASGVVREEAIDSTSCLSVLDEAGEKLTGLLRFAPAPAGDTSARRLTSVTLLFEPDSGDVLLPGDSLARSQPEAGRSAADGTARVPYTQGPQLSNRDDVRRALVANYPRVARDAGIGGSVLYWVLLGEDGKPRLAQVKRSSGVCVLDVAGLRVVQVMRFSPGLLDGKPVKVWVQLPIIFKTYR